MKVAIVTGSSSGIGAATAVELSKRGWNVVVNFSKNEEQAKKVAAQCKSSITVKANVGEDADCRRLAQAVLDRWGRIDALVNNAGTTKFVAHARSRAKPSSSTRASISPPRDERGAPILRDPH